MNIRYNEVVKSPEHLRKNKQHIVIYDTHENCNMFSESCNNCYTLHSAMTVVDWEAMLEDFNTGELTTLVMNKSQGLFGWKVDKNFNEVDVVFTFTPTYHERLNALARLRHFKMSDLIL